MKFYDCQTAPSPRRARIFLAEKGVEVETIEVDLGSGEQLTDAFHYTLFPNFAVSLWSDGFHFLRARPHPTDPMTVSSRK